MNRLTEELVKDILGEQMTPRKKTVGLFGGGFKPPTIGHLEVVQKAVSDYPEMDKMIVLVGSGERDSINQKESLTIWRIYQKYLPSKVEIQPSPEGKAPIGAIYNYGKNNPDERVYWFLGEREGNEGDAEDILKRTKSLRDGKYSNIEFKKIVTSGGVSGTKARKALLARDKDKFLSYIPDIPEQDEIWDILSETMGIMEDKDPIALEDKVLARKGASIYKKGKKHTLKSRRLFKVREMSEGRFILEDQKGRQFWVMDYEMDDKWAKFNPLQVPLHERIAYDAETRMQTRFLMKQFLKNLGTRVESDTEGTLVGKKYELVYKFIPTKRSVGILPFKMSGSSGPKDFEIVITYNPKELTKEFYSELSAEIRNTVRHELEHIAQYRTDKGVRPGEDGIDQDTLPDPEYLTLDYEIPGHIQGLRTKAKAKKISLQQAMEDFFASGEYDLDLDEEDFVRKTWMDWLEKNMPGVSLTKIKEEQLDEGADLINDLIGSGALDWLIEWIYSDRFKYSGIEVQRFVAQLENKAWRREFFDSDAFKEFRKMLGGSILYSRLQLLFQKGFPFGNKEKTLQTFEKLKNHPVIGRIGKAVINTIAGTPLAAEMAADSFKKGYSKFFNMMEKAQFMKILDNVPDKIKEKLRQQSDEILANTQLSEADPKKGTGKKPKGSGRRLYTDEDPSDTVKVKFSTRQDIVDTLNKKSFKNKSHARQSQVINLIHQRTRAAYNRAKDPDVKKRLKSALDYITKRKEASKKKTQRLKDQKKKVNEKLTIGNKEVEKINKIGNNPEDWTITYVDGTEEPYLQHLSEGIIKEGLTPQILSLTQYMGSNGLDLKPYPKIKFISNDKENAEDLLGRTAYYDPNQRLVALYTMGRHPKDILRSYAHELIHHHQNLSGTLDHSQTTNTNEDGDLDRIEREAYEHGNILFRNWEDQIKNGEE